MKSIGAELLQPDALPGVNHMRGMQFKIVLNITVWPDLLIELYKFVCTIPTQNININLRCKVPFSRLLRHTWLNAVMLFYSLIIIIYSPRFIYFIVSY